MQSPPSLSPDAKKSIHFRPKTFGFGVTPCTWQGWAITAVLCAIIIGGAMILLPEENAPPPISAIEFAQQVGRFVLFIAAISWLFLRLTAPYTDGEMKWRWGRNDK